MPSLEALAEAVSAAEGGAISTIVLYPLEVIKTRIQASSKRTATKEVVDGEEVTPHTSSDEITLRQVVEEVYARSGIKGFFAGVQYAAIQSAIEKSVYFYAYSIMKGASKLLTGSFSLRQNLLVGYLAEVIHLPLTVPLEVVITRIITSKGRITSLKQAFDEAVQEKGLAGLYQGLSAYWVLCLKPAIQYTVFEQLRRGILMMLSRRRGTPVKSLTALQAFCLGALSRAIATLVLFPFIRAKKIVMADHQKSSSSSSSSLSSSSSSVQETTSTSSSSSRAPPPSSNSILGIIHKTFKEEGSLALFRGIGPELTRGVLSAAIMLMLKEKLYAVNRRLIVKPSPSPQYAYA